MGAEKQLIDLLEDIKKELQDIHSILKQPKADVSTKLLIDELLTRAGVEKVDVGSYAQYELRRKYSQDRTPVHVSENELLLRISSF